MNFDPMEFLKNASGIQARMEEMKKKMENITVSGFAGGDMVRVDMNGKMEVICVKISPDAIDASDPSMTEQLVKAACSDAYAKVRQKISEEFQMPGFLGV